LILKVVQSRIGKEYLPGNGEWEKKQTQIAGQIVGELRDMGELLGVKSHADIRMGEDISDTIIDVAREENVDLIILGTSIRPGADRLYLGPKVEHILNDAPCPVVVVNSG